eukprot:1917471-Rhodomonas_salina.1
MSGTDIAFGPTRLVSTLSTAIAHAATRCPALTCAYGTAATGRCVCNAVSGTDLAYGPMRLLREDRVCCYQPVRDLPAHDGHAGAIALRACYAMSGTDIAYAV